MLQAAAYWTVLGFLAGAMPFSLWLGRWLLRDDIRLYGNGNPGAVNAWRAGGWRIGVLAILLDSLKGALPAGLAQLWSGLSDWYLLPVALAPVLGHAFSPFLGFHGGKAVAVTFGIWCGLTAWEGPTVLGCLFGFFLLIQTVDAWAVTLGMSCFALYLLLRQFGAPVLMICAGNLLVVAWKHRRDLGHAPELRGWLRRCLARRR